MPITPRYFIGRTAPATPPTDAALPPEHVVDCFRTGGNAEPEREWLVVSDALGRLTLLPDLHRSDLPPNVQQELACHEIAGAKQPRRLDAAELFLFNLQFVEQPVPDSGVDDPVYLYGTLFGPFPAAAGSFTPGLEGQLTATRLDLLEGLGQSAEHAFSYPGHATGSGEPARCFHLVLPGDREEEVRAGRGLVLAYPLVPAELSLHEPGNEIIIRRLWHDLLSALQEDLLQEAGSHPLCERTLPVPSRHLLEEQLRGEGYEIEGDLAIKKPSSEPGFRGILQNVLGALRNEPRPLPPEGTVEDFLALSREALSALPGFPPPRTLALRQRVNSAQPGTQFPVSKPVPTQGGTASPAVLPVGSSPPRLVPLGRREPTDWMKDFMAGHAPQAAPKRARSQPAKPPASPRGEPHWMSDFTAPPTTPPTAPPIEPQQPGRTDEPDWSGDFK